MFTFCHTLTNKILLSVLFVGLAASAAAHTYFFGVTDLNLNSNTQHIEIIHQFTAHDIENTIAEIKQVHFSGEHPKYDQYIQDYFVENFTLKHHQRRVELNWIGFEIKRGKLFAYQESHSKSFLTGLVVQNTILINTYSAQINTVNYQSISDTEQVQGSLTFNKSKQVAVISPVKKQKK